MVAELRAVVEELGGESALGQPVRTEEDIRTAIREGFRPDVLERLMRSAHLTLKELATSLDVSPRSLQRRRQTGRLAQYESDRIYRLARIIALAKHSLGDEDAAIRWLKRPNRALGAKTPFDLMDTEPGTQAVERVLGRIAYGGIS